MSYIGKEPQTGAYSMLDALTASATASYSLTLDSTAFVPESANHLLVSLNGSIQKAGSSYTVSGSTLTFSSTLASSDSIDFVLALGNVLDIGTPSDATVTNAKTSFVSTSSSAGLQIKGDGTTDGTLQLNCSQNTHGIKLRSPAHSAGASYTLTFPTTDGNANEYLQTNGSGTLTWATAGGGLTRVGGGSATGQNLGDISFDVFSSTYNMYFVSYRINMIADSSQVLMRVRNSSGYKTNAGYAYGTHGINHSGTESSTTASGNTSVRLTGGTTSNDGHHSCVGHIIFYRPYSSSHVTAFTLSNQEVDESYIVTSRAGGGEHQVAETHVGFGFLGNNQNIEQYDIQIYGMNES
jgi:hypothetical protein